MPDYDFQSVEKKWRERWNSAKLYEAKRDGRKKFFIIFAYPGVSGYLHVGHMRGYTYTDVLARYKRMTGHNVFFPVGAHATGNIAIALASKVERGDEKTINYLRANGCPEEEIGKLKDPNEVVRFFSKVYVEDYWKKFGFLADWSAFTTTIDDGYHRFIEWQFLRLKELGLLTQKPYYAPMCIRCGPVAVDPSETDISKGGNAEKLEYTLLKFKIDGMDDVYLMAATLRPETVFGQTNFWVNPEVEYVIAKVDDEKWIISEQAAMKLRYQGRNLEVLDKIKGSELIGKTAIAPMIHRPIPVLPSKFSDPNIGTGLVTSVPSDAPHDWMGLYELQNDPELCRKYGLDPEMVKKIEVIPIIKTKGYGPTPAVEICERMGIKSSTDPRLEEAKKEIYSAGFHTGLMNENCGEFAGLPVNEAKESMKQKMIEMGEADIMYDLSEEVICRCGAPVVIGKVEGQWFIRYSDEDWKKKAKEHAREMNILPKLYYDNIHGVIDWYLDRACARLGNWLGTRLPWDKKWIIEAISDSTLYPAYYVVSKHVNAGHVKPEQMIPAFFDYVFLGKGEINALAEKTGISEDVLREIRADFDYWYPLDINLGGKEHMTVHFPVFLMNHVAILNKKHWPKGIFVNWYIMMSGGKISKSKGGAVPIPDAAEKYSVDGLRLYYCHIGSPFVDVEWKDKTVMLYRSKVESIWRMLWDIFEMEKDDSWGHMDRWLISRINRKVKEIREAMDSFELRNASNATYYEIPADIKWYLRRGGRSEKAMMKAIDTWVRLMAPFTPHMAEEFWEAMGNEGFVSVADFPEYSESEVHEEDENYEDYLKSVMEDVEHVIKIVGKNPEKIVLYTSPEWKYEAMERIANSDMKNIGALIKQIIETAPPEYKKMVPKFVQNMVKRIRAEGKPAKLDEKTILEEALPFLKEEYGCEVLVESADNPGYNPAGKAKMAEPVRPAIYVE